ncbi:MAG: magnesium transporter [Clostridia bacterium]|nr:magnesium transporter [Clostridia bacterium]
MDFSFDELREIVADRIEGKKYAELKTLFGTLEPADIASLLEGGAKEHLALLFRILPKSLAAEVFVEMDSDVQESLLNSFSDRELSEMLDELYLDDTVDIIEEMPANVVRRVLANTDAETRSTINQLMRYPKDSAGSIMTVEYVSLRRSMTVEMAFAHIRKTGFDKETVYTCYVTDDAKHLVGVVSVRSLLLSPYDALIGDVMDENVIWVSTTEDQEATAELFGRYDFLAIPVVDNEKRLVGIITFDDAIDVIQEEATEDMELMAAIVPSEHSYFKTGIFATWKNRIPWLLLLMISATFTGAIISSFESRLGAMLILTSYIPMLMDTGGNAGGQASVTIIRALSLGDVAFRDIFRVIWKEIRVSVLCGGALAAINFIKMIAVDRYLFGNEEVTMAVAFVVCVTMFVTVFIAKVIGCSLPILAKKVGFDPAVMASPFITTIVDALALLVYFDIASSILTF